MPISKQDLEKIERHSNSQLRALNAMFDLLDKGREEAEKKRQQERGATDANKELG
jgi:hypothetical protein|tara:strand:+ start:28720 stop:28884 length:165 start_codon:yes stop_codon:yes gene_type:complete